MATRWAQDTPATEGAIREVFRREGLSPSEWSNGPGDRYAVHSHPYHKVLFCVRGSIRFQAGEPPEDCDLRPGDRLDIPPGTPHSAVVGTEGVSCLEAPRRANQ